MQAASKYLSAFPVALLAITTAACMGEIKQGKPGYDPGAGPEVSGGGTGNMTASVACEEHPAPRAPLRRLTRFEYNNTVRDLLGDTSLPANAFPSELLGNGFGNDADSQPVGTELSSQFMKVSEKISATATADDKIASLAPCAAQLVNTADAAAEASCVRGIADSFGAKAYRRALVPGEAESMVALFQAVRATSDFRTSLAAMLQGILQSPEFVYKPEFGVPVAGKDHLLKPTGDEMATRLSYLYWASTPDDGLRMAAASGALESAEGIRAQAERLLASEKARPVVREFFDKLLPISDLSSLARDATEFPTFSPKIGALMRQETQTFLENLIFDSDPKVGTWPAALTADYTYVNEPLAGFYGMTGVSGEDFRKVPLNTAQRRGLLTQAGILAGPIHTNHANPVVRGSFVVQKLLCTPIPFPTGDIAAKVTPPDPNSAATARQRFTQHSKDATCFACHQHMDPVGYALEKFDVVGNYREQENGVDIDTSGETDLLPAPFDGAIELGQRLAESPAAQACFAQQWMNYGYGRNVTENEACTVKAVTERFQKANYNVKELLVALSQSDAFLYLPKVRQ